GRPARRDGPIAARARGAVRDDAVRDRAPRAWWAAAAHRHAPPHRGRAQLRSRRRARAARRVAMPRVAVVGDSISAGSPLWDPDPAVRARIAAPDEHSQWQWWAAQADPSLEFR